MPGIHNGGRVRAMMKPRGDGSHLQEAFDSRRSTNRCGIDHLDMSLFWAWGCLPTYLHGVCVVWTLLVLGCVYRSLKHLDIKELVYVPVEMWPPSPQCHCVRTQSMWVCRNYHHCCNINCQCYSLPHTCAGLISASIDGDLEKVQRLLRQGANINNTSWGVRHVL